MDGFPTYIPVHDLQILLPHKPITLISLHGDILHIETLVVSRSLIVDLIYIFSKMPEDQVLNIKGRQIEFKLTCSPAQSTSLLQMEGDVAPSH